MAESVFFRKMVKDLYFGKVKEDIRQGKYQVVVIPAKIRSARYREEVLNKIKKRKEITTFLVMPDNTVLMGFRPDYEKYVIESLRKRHIVATKDVVREVLKVRELKKSFGSNNMHSIHILVNPVPEEIEREIMNRDGWRW